MGIQLIAEPVYHPSGGMNIDSNGISMRGNECVDAVNVDIYSSGVKQRRGTKALPSQLGRESGPVIKYHRYIDPVAGSILFAFCASDVYRYVPDFGWRSVYSGASFTVDSWSITNVIDRTIGTTVVAAGSNYSSPTSAYADASSRVLLYYDGSGWYSIDGLGTDSTNGGFIFLGVFHSPSLILEVEFTLGDPDPVFTPNWIINAYRSTGNRFIGVRALSDTSVRAVAGGTITTPGEYIDITITAGERANVKVNAATGEVWYNGVSQGFCSVTAGGTETIYPLALLREVGATNLVDQCFIFKVIINETTTWVADAVNKRFYDLDNPTTHVYSQFNSIFPSDSPLKWWQSPSNGDEWYVAGVASSTTDPNLIEPEKLSYLITANGESREGNYVTKVAPAGIGTLPDDRWAYGDGDTLGFDTVYWNPIGITDPPTYPNSGIRLVGFQTAAYNDFATGQATGETIEIGMIPLQLKKNLYDEELYDLTSGPTSSDETLVGPGTNARTLTAERTIVSGTAYLVAGTIGVIATASLATYIREFGSSPNLEERVTNRWIPVDETEVAFSDNSYIDLTTGDFSIELLTAVYDGQELTIYYQYEEDVNYKPLVVTNYYNALVLANTAEYFFTDDPPTVGEWKYTPWRTRWSEQGNMFLFRENHYADLALDDITPILAVKSLETAASSTIIGPLYFYKHNSIIRGTYNQNYNLDPSFPVPMLNFEIAFSEGVEAVNTISTFGGRHVFLGRNDIYAFDGVSRISLTKDNETGNTRIQKYIFDNLDLNYLDACFSVYDEIERKYYLFLKLTTNTGEYPTDCFVLDLDLMNWVRHTYTGVSAAINIDLIPGGTINSLVGTIDNLSSGDPLAPIINNLTANRSKLLLFSIGDYSYSVEQTPVDEIDINDVAFSSYIITRDFFGQTLEDMDRIQKVYLEGKSGNINISHSCCYELGVGNYDFPVDLTFSSKYKRESYNPDSVTNAVRFLMYLSDGVEFRWMQVFSKRQEFTNE